MGCRLFRLWLNSPIPPPKEIIHRLNVFLNVDLPGMEWLFRIKWKKNEFELVKHWEFEYSGQRNWISGNNCFQFVIGQSASNEEAVLEKWNKKNQFGFFCLIIDWEKRNQRTKESNLTNIQLNKHRNKLQCLQWVSVCGCVCVCVSSEPVETLKLKLKYLFWAYPNTECPSPRNTIKTVLVRYWKALAPVKNNYFF